MKHLLKLMDLSKEEICSILNTADQLKYEKKHGIIYIQKLICEPK